MKRVSHAYQADAKTKQWRRTRRLLILVGVIVGLPLLMGAIVLWRNYHSSHEGTPRVFLHNQNPSTAYKTIAGEGSTLDALWKQHDDTQRQIAALQEENRKRLHKIKHLHKEK